MLTQEYSLKNAVKIARENGREIGKEEGIEKGIEKGQNDVLELVKQGLSYEEIKKKIKKVSKKKRA